MTRSNENAQTVDASAALFTDVPSPLALATLPGTIRAGERIRRYLSCLRIGEILFLQATPFFGALFALRTPSPETVGPLALLTIANLLLMAHVFLLNDWSGLSGDLFDRNRAGGVFTARGVGREEIARFSAALLLCSLALFAMLGTDTLMLAAAIAALSALYSLPRFHWKGRPILSSAAHFIGGIIHFLLGYSLWSGVDGRGVLIATFFALTFAAGHLTQEVRDRDADLRNGIRTNAVAFGPRATFLAGLIVFALACGVLVFMAVENVLPRPLAALGLLYQFHLRWSLQTLHDGLPYAGIVRLQHRYRALYGVIGIAMVAALAGARLF